MPDQKYDGRAIDRQQCECLMAGLREIHPLMWLYIPGSRIVVIAPSGTPIVCLNLPDARRMLCETWAGVTIPDHLCPASP